MKTLKTLVLVPMIAVCGLTAAAYGNDDVQVRGTIRVDFGGGTIEYRTPRHERVVVIERPVRIYTVKHRYVRHPYRGHGWAFGHERFRENGRDGHRDRTVIVEERGDRTHGDGGNDRNGRPGRDGRIERRR